MNRHTKKQSVIKLFFLAAAACLLYGIGSGIRANYGILATGISGSSGIPYASVSFVLAIAQLVFGITQPLFGILAIRTSNRFVLVTGSILMAAGLLGIPFCQSMWALLPFLGLLFPAGTGAVSFGIIMSTVTPLMNEKEAAAVSGIVTAGCGLGGTFLAPIMQKLLFSGSLRTASFALCIPVLCLIPISIGITSGAAKTSAGGKKEEDGSLKQMFAGAFRNPSYLFLVFGFFTCGFHMAIIETHLFSQFLSYGLSEDTAAYAFSVYGIAVILGAILSGVAGSRFPMKNVLGGIYTIRIFIVSLFLLLPKTIPAIFVFSILFGLTASATVPPTSGLVGKLFGPAQMATLFGMVFVAHQIGCFFSSWLGGLCIQLTHGYTLIWSISILLTAIASIASFAVKEPGYSAYQERAN